MAIKPGNSPTTNQTNRGARTDSNNINNDTSGVVRYLGPSVSNHVAAPINKPWPKKRAACLPNS